MKKQHVITYFELDKRGYTQSNVDFVNVDLENDNLLFIDPRLIEIGRGKVFNEMRDYLKVYFQKLVTYIRSKDQANILLLCSGLSEPKETKLGYADKGSNGKSISKGLIPEFVGAISKNKALATGIVHRVGDLDLFVENIGCDRISDITTKIVKPVLIKFTQSCCRKYGIPQSDIFQQDLLNLKSLTWENGNVSLPIYKGRGVILIPKWIVRRQNDANSNMSAFIRFSENNYVLVDSNETKGVPRNGKDSTVLKKDFRAFLKTKNKSNKGYLKEKASEWIAKYDHLLDEFRIHQSENNKIKPLSDNEISQVVE